jgi:hypothetical protein
MIDRNLNEISEADLQRLVTDGAQDGEAFSFSADLDLYDKDANRAMLQKVASYANRRGGDIIFGIEAGADRRAKAVVPLKSYNPSHDDTRIKTLVFENIFFPRISLCIRAVPLSSGGIVLIVRVWKSNFAPRHFVFEFDLPKILKSAGKYCEAGRWEEAFAQFSRLSPHLCDHPDVDVLKVHIYCGLGRWEHAADLAERLIDKGIIDGSLHLQGADALRHLGSIARAKALLLRGEGVLGSEALFHYRLALYEAMLGECAAKDRLARALILDPHERIKDFFVKNGPLEPLCSQLYEESSLLSRSGEAEEAHEAGSDSSECET